MVKTDGDFLGCTGGIGETDGGVGVGEIFGGIENPFVFIANLLFAAARRGFDFFGVDYFADFFFDAFRRGAKCSAHVDGG